MGQITKLTFVLVFLDVVISLAEYTLDVNPSTMLINMPSGYLEVQEIELFNPDNKEYRVDVKFDTSWIDLNPFKFDMGAGAKRKLLVFFFIPENEIPNRSGRIVYYQLGTNHVLGVTDVCINPTKEQESHAFSGQLASHEKKLENAPARNNPVNNEQIVDLNYRIQELEQEVDASHYLITNLKDELNRKEVELLKLLNSQKAAPGDYTSVPFPQSNSNQNASQQLRVLYQLLYNALEKDIQNGEAVLTWQNGKIYFSIPGKIAFMSGSNYLRLHGEKILDKFSNVLNRHEEKNFRLMVVGHTDSIQYRRDNNQKTFGNWELSALRAAKVVKLLQMKTQYEGKKLYAACNASYSPITENKTAEGRVQNRRIEVLVSDYITGTNP